MIKIYKSITNLNKKTLSEKIMKTYLMKIITNAIKIIAAAQTIENQLYYCHSNSLRLINPKKRKTNQTAC